MCVTFVTVNTGLQEHNPNYKADIILCRLQDCFWQFSSTHYAPIEQKVENLKSALSDNHPNDDDVGSRDATSQIVDLADYFMSRLWTSLTIAVLLKRWQPVCVRHIIGS